jgi:hypothetical protein
VAVGNAASEGVALLRRQVPADVLKGLGEVMIGVSAVVCGMAISVAVRCWSPKGRMSPDRHIRSAVERATTSQTFAYCDPR